MLLAEDNNVSKTDYFLKIRVPTFIVTLLLLVILIGCKPISKQSSIFSPQICKPPCWQNIYPGKSSLIDVVDILNKLDFVDPKTISTQGEPWAIFNDVVYATLQTGKIKAEIFFLGDKVSKINFSGTINMDFSQAIEELGTPEYIINIPLSGGMPLAPTSSFNIIAIIPEQGIGYSFDTRSVEGKLKKEIQPESMITKIFFFNPNDYEIILNAGLFSTPYLTGEETQKYMIPWTGYGSILEKYPPAIIK